VEIEDLFKRSVKVTVIVRVPGNDNADVLVTNEPDLSGIRAVLDRSEAGRNARV
jgi:hypothetical protein